MSEAAINALLSRLESVANRLESVEKQLAAGGGPAAGGGAAAGPSAASVDAYGSLISQYIDEYVNLSGKLDPTVKQQADLVKRAVEAQKAMISTASKSKKPSDAVLANLLKPTADLMGQINKVRDGCPRSGQWFNHLSTISEGISALAWVTVSPTPGPHVDDARASSEFYSNKLLVQYRKDTSAAAQTHVAWVTAWNTFLKDLRAYIKQYHTTELTWNPQGGDASAAAPSGGSSSGGAPAAPGAPPPPPPIDVAALNAAANTGAQSRTALLAEINAVKERQTGGKTEGLKHVTKDMKTKYQTEAAAPLQPKAKPAASTSKPKPAAKGPGGPPKLALEGNKWVVEFQHGNKSVVIDNPEPKQTVYIYKCEDSVVQIKGKVNAITIDTCKKTGIVFDNAISVAEAVNCSSIQIQCTGKVPAIQVDKTSGCQIFLSNEGLGVEIVTSKSDELNVCLPGRTPSDDITEIAIPEQFKTTINPSTRALSTEAVAHV